VSYAVFRALPLFRRPIPQALRRDEASLHARAPH
jgi:hypothetical protein